MRQNERDIGARTFLIGQLFRNGISDWWKIPGRPAMSSRAWTHHSSRTTQNPNWQWILTSVSMSLLIADWWLMSFGIVWGKTRYFLTGYCMFFKRTTPICVCLRNIGCQLRRESLCARHVRRKQQWSNACMGDITYTSVELDESFHESWRNLTSMEGSRWKLP